MVMMMMMVVVMMNLCKSATSWWQQRQHHQCRQWQHLNNVGVISLTQCLTLTETENGSYFLFICLRNKPVDLLLCVSLWHMLKW